MDNRGRSGVRIMGIGHPQVTDNPATILYHTSWLIASEETRAFVLGQVVRMGSGVSLFLGTR
jgi:hypothetical protein